jgi:hypothetical protein
MPEFLPVRENGKGARRGRESCRTSLEGGNLGRREGRKEGEREEGRQGEDRWRKVG